MKVRLVIDDTSVYEIDEECMQQKKKMPKERNETAHKEQRTKKEPAS